MSKHSKHSSPFMDASYRVTVSDPEIHFIEIDCFDDIFDFIVNAPYSRIKHKDWNSFSEPSDRELLEAVMKNASRETSDKPDDCDKEKVNPLRLTLYALQRKNAYLENELKCEKAFADCAINALIKLNKELTDRLKKMKEQLKNRGDDCERAINVQQLKREKAALEVDKAYSDKRLRNASAQLDVTRAELIRTKDKLEKCEEAYARLHQAYTVLAHSTTHSYADFDK